MATIALYGNKINQMPGLIKEVKKTVTDYKSELSALKTKSLSINKSVCDVDDVINSIQTSTQTQEEKIDSLDEFNQNCEDFISDVVRIDGDVADLVNQRKEEFYDKYSYLNPDCEKKDKWKWVKGIGRVLKKAGDWCKEHWKAIGKIVLAVIIIAAIGIASVLTGGVLAVILAGAFWCALSGALIGGVMGGALSALTGGSFLDGFADGALSGAIEGSITGAVFSGVGLGITAVKNSKYFTKISKLNNFKKCKAFSDKVEKVLGKSAKKEIHINLENGSRFRADFVKKSKFTEELNIFEIKGSETAKFTKGQMNSFAKNGNKLVDSGRFALKGKSIFGDISIAKGTYVKVIRPRDLLYLNAKLNISMPAGFFGGGLSGLNYWFKNYILKRDNYD